jgi:hypothetical protein
VGKDQPHAQKPVYISRPTNITDLFRHEDFDCFWLAWAAKKNAVPDAAEENYEVVYLG